MPVYRNVVCALMLYGLMVAAYPTGDCDGVDLGLVGIPVEGVAEFSGTAPALGSVTILGHSPCPELLISNPITPIVLEKDDAAALVENDEISSQISRENDENDNNIIPKEVILGAIIADSITAEKSAEIDAKLAEIDEFVEAELGNLGPLIQSALRNADTSEVESCVDSALLEMESQIDSELAMVDEFIESELATTQELVKLVLENPNLEESHLKTTECQDDTDTAQMEAATIREKEALVELGLEMLESFVESELAKTQSVIEAELEKVNELVESELAKVDTIVKSELDKVELFVETELAKTDALVKSEVSKMESFVETELAKVEIPVEEIAEFNADVPAAATTMSDDVSIVDFSVTVPVSGRILIFGSTGCPPLLPTAEPVPLYVESFPILENFEFCDYSESYDTEQYIEEMTYDDSVTEVPVPVPVPVAGEVRFTGVAPSVGSCTIRGACTCDPVLPLINREILKPPMVGPANPYFATHQIPVNVKHHSLTRNNMQNETPDVSQIKILPTVNIRRNGMKAGEDQNPGVAIVEGEVGFRGTTRASGSASLFAEFPCPPLTANEVGPDGKKYIWIAKPSDSETRLKHSEARSSSLHRPRPEFPISKYTADFPETVIMDASKNYEKLISETMDVDYGILGPILVAGEAIFEGTAPAFGSVSIRGECV